MNRVLFSPSSMMVTWIFLSVISMISCRHEPVQPDDRDILITLNGKILTFQEVVSRIPVGIEPEDSAALFSVIVDQWVETEVLSELAESKLPNLEDIESKVENYRNRLIITEYLERMKESRSRDVASDSVRAYYEAHKRELLTESPLVKGVYMKISSNSTGKDAIRELIFRSSDEDIDCLEKDWMETALQYDYFGGTWVDWQTLADQIPYRFYDPDAFLKTTKNFETTYNGSTYLFHIMDYLPTGSVQPFDFASGRISSILEQSKIASYEKALVRSLIEKAKKEKRLVPGSYDPVSHTYRQRMTGLNNNIKDNEDK